MTKPITPNANLKWPDVKDDYVVRYEGHVVGRIRLGGDRFGQGNSWEWSIGCERKCRRPRRMHERIYSRLRKVLEGNQSGAGGTGMGARANFRGTATKGGVSRTDAT